MTWPEAFAFAVGAIVAAYVLTHVHIEARFKDHDQDRWPR